MPRMMSEITPQIIRESEGYNLIFVTKYDNTLMCMHDHYPNSPHNRLRFKFGYDLTEYVNKMKVDVSYFKRGNSLFFPNRLTEIKIV